PTLAEFVKQPHPTWKVDLRSTYNTQYSAGGPRGIIDGIHGDKNWRKGGWQGYQDQDFELILELDSIQDIRRLRTTFLQDTRSWIIFPTAVEYLYSTDGVNYQTIVKLQPSIGPEDYEVQIAEFKHLHTTTISARFIKVVAKNFGELPAWHQGAGGGAFIFVDEVEVE
ncbi:MAG: discoidin domain-containing protein, partial [Flavobacteriales bacterium]|nr:discoidin domain-containing protein [Flavobacteriales bacterium]